MIHSDIGSAIKELRKALGDISQERFARKLGTTTRTIARWEAAEALSPQILSRLRAMAIGVGARDAADFFEGKLREKLDWEPDTGDAQPASVAPEEAIPSDASWCHWRATPVEKLLVSEFLKRYRADDKTIRLLVEDFLISIQADLHLENLRLDRQNRRLKTKEAAQSLLDLMKKNMPPESYAEMLRALPLTRPSGEKRKK